MTILTPARGFLAAAVLMCTAVPGAPAQHSAAREWNELLLASIRKDFARPTIHARNLYHTAIAMWDAWATYDAVAQPVLFAERHATTDPRIDAWRSESLSYAVYRLLRSRFASSPGARISLPRYDQLMASYGYDPHLTSTVGNSPAAIGNRIAATVLAYGDADNSNERNGYANRFYQPINPPLLPALPGNPRMLDPNRWQPLALDFFIDQGGNIIIGGYPAFLSPEWGAVSSFALSQNDVVVHRRDGFDYWVFHDPGAPPYLGGTGADEFKWTFELVSVWSSHLDPSDGVMIDVSPASIGNATLPNGPADYPQFYDLVNGGDSGPGYPVNPVTGQPYAPQIVPRGDYARVLAEFWADGPDSETPPGHWFTIANYVSDHPLTQKRIGGVGPIVSDFEWDVKCYLALGGAMHDCGVTTWGIKGWYDYVRPVSALRYMADRGQSSDPNGPSYHPDGIPLLAGFIEVVTAATTAPGQRHAHLIGSEGKIAIKAWRGPRYIGDPRFDVAGVDWILAENWWPYQRPTFVSPPFAGYTSGHSSFSRAGAVVLHRMTGSRWFPGGLGEFVCPQDGYLVFERGPSQTVRLQWASYYDASDQCSLSRIWGGIHPPADDIPGRKIGQEVGGDAFALAEQYWAGQAPSRAAYTTSGAGCPGSAGIVLLSAAPYALPVRGSTARIDVTRLPATAGVTAMALGVDRRFPGVDLRAIGMPCTLDFDILAAEGVVASSGRATWTFPIGQSWPDATIYHQAFTIDPSANVLGVSASVLGNARIGR